jgi:hypothetical protein
MMKCLRILLASLFLLVTECAFWMCFTTLCICIAGCWSELSCRPCFRSGAAATSPVICCFGELLVRGCIDTDYIVRILNHVVNHYMFLFYTLLEKILCIIGAYFYILSEHISIHYCWLTLLFLYVRFRLFYGLNVGMLSSRVIACMLPLISSFSSLAAPR